MDDLKQKIQAQTACISPEMLKNFRLQTHIEFYNKHSEEII
jgi:hypothetical protein